MKLRRASPAALAVAVAALVAVAAIFGFLAVPRSGPAEIHRWTSHLCNSPLANSDTIFDNIRKDASWTRCPGLDWLTDIVMASSKPLVYVEIGCALGYSLAEFVAGSGSEISPATLHAKLHQLDIDQCGRCNNCKLRPLTRNITARIDAYCVEASPQNYRTLLSVKEAFFSDIMDGAYLSILNYFVGNPSQDTIQVPSLASGEDISLHELPAWETPVEVAAITVDRLAEFEHLRAIDVLNIDIRGDGPKVVEGAAGMLKSQRISILLLTLTQTGCWQSPHALKRQVDMLWSYGYYCFWAGKTGLVPITACYVETYAKVTLGRMVCAPVISPYFPYLAALIV